MDFCEQALAGHLFRLGDPHQREHGGADVAEAAGAQRALRPAEDQRHGVGGMGRVGAAVGGGNALGVAMVGGDEQHAAHILHCPGDDAHALVHHLHRFDDGLEIIRNLIFQSVDFLNPGGILILETGEYNAFQTKKIMEDSEFKDVKIYKDLEGQFRNVSGILA